MAASQFGSQDSVRLLDSRIAELCANVCKTSAANRKGWHKNPPNRGLWDCWDSATMQSRFSWNDRADQATHCAPNVAGCNVSG